MSWEMLSRMQRILESNYSVSPILLLRLSETFRMFECVGMAQMISLQHRLDNPCVIKNLSYVSKVRPV